MLVIFNSIKVGQTAVNSHVDNHAVNYLIMNLIEREDNEDNVWAVSLHSRRAQDLPKLKRRAVLLHMERNFLARHTHDYPVFFG